MEDLENIKEICVDTDIIIDFLKKKAPGSLAYKKWKQKTHVLITSITVFELLQSARQSDYGQERYEEAKNLIQQQNGIAAFEVDAADMASKIASDLRRSGKGIEIRDIVNASICMSRGLPLLTRNKDHYQRVSGLKLLDT